jgi:hypothetical protein
MDTENREESIRKFGTTSGVMLYAHLGCREKLLERIAREGMVIQPDRDGAKQWKPHELIGHYKDIDRCDVCSRPFQETDEGYISVWATTAEELAIWERVREEKPGEQRA